jgi:predicted RNA methylase
MSEPIPGVESAKNAVIADELTLGQFIPPIYHYNMLNDEARMGAFEQAIEVAVQPGARVLELGGGTAVLSWFAARRGATVHCVERNPELVRAAQRFLAMNPGGERVTMVQADAMSYLPPQPVDVVVCEMLHVGMLREKQIAVIESFKQRYLARFGGPLPRFVPEAFFNGVQPVCQSYHFHGYHAPVALFQDPLALQPRTVAMGVPVVYQRNSYEMPLAVDCGWQGDLVFSMPGEVNALRFITKNVVAVDEHRQITVDWFNQYLVVPLAQPVQVQAGSSARVRFAYHAGDAVEVLQPELQLL